MNLKSTRVLSVSVIVILIGACSNLYKKDIAEGVIEYSCNALDKKENLSFTIPSKMLVKFKNDYYAAELEAGLGFAKMKFISDPIKKEFRSQVFFFEKRQSTMNFSEVEMSNHYLPDYDVVYGKETQIIAGYKCEKATLKFKNGTPSYDIWFTKQIAIKNPNWSNAYYKIDGVLMNYCMKKYGLELHFIATSVSIATIDDSYFNINEEYKDVKNSEIEKLFDGFFSFIKPKNPFLAIR
ncbi:MAG: hypothetical protein EXR20_02770 [Bacteroidetes bacterium]|nr:hypothetical protein [Bacteroidota bacterium]